MKVIMLLADAAQVCDGKLYILGGGWSVTGPDPVPSALAMKIEVPWDQGNMRHKFEARLYDADGMPVMIETPQGTKPILVGGEFETGRPAGLKPGTPLDVPLAFGLGPLALKPGSRYVWRLSIDGHHDENWQAAFSTRPRK
ncbi:MAG TPA: hypothetical protein VD902_07815 [Symbiobacteriaceae bacterium]|nr:hypothetical protein [Symbiobacteriaceae bacterium]